MNILTEPYREQAARWPNEGRHILAQYDSDSIIVYQAYRSSIGRFAAENGYFGGEFSLNRMSWIKPNFLWMMYRSGWGKKTDQETVLAIRMELAAFETILARAVHTTFEPTVYSSVETLRQALAESPVRVQWDPDHDPSGKPVTRRAVQLGLGGDVLASYARRWILDIQEITDFVHAQHLNAMNDFSKLLTPMENVYRPKDCATISRLQIATIASPEGTIP